MQNSNSKIDIWRENSNIIGNQNVQKSEIIGNEISIDLPVKIQLRKLIFGAKIQTILLFCSQF